MKKFSCSRLRLLTWAVLFAAGGFASCSDDEKGDNPPPPPVELKNQIEYDGGKPIDIKSAIFDVEDTDLYTLLLSPTSGITDLAGMTAANDYLSVVVRNPKGTVNTDDDTFEISYRDISVKKQTVNDVEKVQLSADLVAETSQLNLYVEVVLKSGKTLLARYNHTCTQAVPQRLDNQWELDKVASAIGSVVQWHTPSEGFTTYYFYTGSNVAAPSPQTPADMEITLADGIETADIDLSAADPEQVSIRCGEFLSGAGTTGTLSIVRGESPVVLTVALDARNGGSHLRAAYAGPFTSGFESSNSICVTAGDTPEEADLKRVFRYKESIMNNYAFGLADAQSPEGLMEGHYAVQLGVSNLAIGTTIDLATEASKCTFVLYDYINYTTYDIGKTSGQGVTGTITTAGSEERIYLQLSVAFPDGPTVEGEWFGDVTTVQEAFDLTPVKPFVPHMKVVSPDGEVVMDRDLTTMEMRLEKDYALRGGDPEYGGATFDAYFLYFRHDSGSPVETAYEYPMLMIPASYLNSTELDLAVGQEDLYWIFRFQNHLFSKPEYSERYEMFGSMYGYCPDEVKTTVVRNADKTWRISFRMKDYGSFSSWNPDAKEGTENTLTIEWEGSATKYSGTSKNDYPDADY